MNTIRNNKTFWKTAQRCFSKKGKYSSRITIVSDEKRTADLMNKFFISIKFILQSSY